MDSVIAVLPQNVVDQIAAGEVIERPASVVKELVDNAIDAGAKTITVETRAGGRAMLRVVDDGCGMGPKDAIKAFERYATSKLRAVDDLWGIATMGFRGEALAAIASVARVVLTTRRAGDDAATCVEIAAGRLVGVTEVGAPVGTSIEVSELFGNVPARLKFLKGEGTEASHVTELVARVAMAHPLLHVRLRHDGRVAMEVPPDRDSGARARALLGPRVAARIVESVGEEGGVRVAAYLAAPEHAQTTARGVQLFVGRRAVRDRGLLHAIAMGYGELVPRGRYPVAVVMIDVPAGAVDVNVHPQKLEVRFSDASAVQAAVRHVVQAGVARAPWRDEHAGGPVMMAAIAGVQPPALPWGGEATPLAQRHARDVHSQPRFGFGEPNSGQRALALGSDDGARAWVSRVHRANRAAEAALVARALHRPTGADVTASGRGGAEAQVAATSAPLRFDSAAPHDEAQLAEGSSPSTAPGYFASLRYLGQVDLTYLVCEGDGEIVLVDQHVAHERVELARLMGAGEREIAVQRMLFPTTIEVAPELVALAEQNAGVLARVGFEAEAFGASTLAIKAMPGGLRHGDPAQLLRTLLADWAEDGTPSESERLERVLAEIACHSVVRAGDRLTAGEAEALLAALDAVDPATPCPHDRPVLLRLPLAEIARRFGR
jgi:DNA mismatch repair protein MutL